MAGRLSMASVFAIALVALFATPAMAADRAHAEDVCTNAAVEHAGEAKAVEGLNAAMAASIKAIFEAPVADPAAQEGTTDGPSLQLMVARVKDGKPVMACVDSKEAATRFLAAPIAKIRARAAEEK